VPTPVPLADDPLSFLPLASLSVGKVLQVLSLPFLMKGSVTSLLRLIPSALFSLPTFASSTKLTPKIRDDSCIFNEARLRADAYNGN
jgi:hypothetical protein